MLYRPHQVGLSVALISGLISYALWRDFIPCGIYGCPADVTLLGFSIAAWGALFYLTVALLFWCEAYRVLPVVLGTGILVHAGLFLTNPQFCWLCIILFCLSLGMLGLVLSAQPPALAFIANKPGNVVVVLLIIAAAGLGIGVSYDIHAKTGWTPFNAVPAKNAVAEASNPAAGRLPPSLLAVTTPDGIAKKVNLAVKPALVISPHCKHCGEVLQTVADLPQDRRPYIIALNGSEAEVKNKLADAGLSPAFYFLDEDLSLQWVPSLVWMEQEKRCLEDGIGPDDLLKILKKVM